jgi:hypothetical protein
VDERLLAAVERLREQAGAIGERDDGGGNVVRDEFSECLPAPVDDVADRLCPLAFSLRGAR